ncbi:tripartite ATP-independent transporter DctP family solute receptor [Gallaecimonas pentaromativorans]|uniref:Tripartite ATP-independent transporter DctP family solute receptor n=2 Tax=Gallaecimonas pentaromativorans TaxID=584787 RepID=A0A3N1PFC2_9GAMM|nr:tripartite ATP-independent transporter DctP family solute receptor [Gallaecimonas pentaromativorans]
MGKFMRALIGKLLPVALGLMLLGGCHQESKVTVLRMAHTLDSKHVVHQSMEYMAQRLELYSGGQMRLMIYPNGQLGTERELVELLQIGSLAMTKVSASTLEGFVPQMQLFSIPYVFKDRDQFWRVLDSDIGQNLLAQTRPAHLIGLGYYDAGSRSFYSSKGFIQSPADIKGKKIRVLNSPTAVKMINTMGGAATPIAWGELYAALQQGVVDGAENNPPSYYLSHHYEVAPYYSLDEHSFVPDVILASQKVWDSLNPQQQKWLRQAVDDSIVFEKNLWQKASDDAIKAVEAKGVEVIRPDKAPFIAAVKPIHDSFKGTAVGRLLERIKTM